MAIWHRGRCDALLHHSDRGSSQYTSEQFQIASFGKAVPRGPVVCRHSLAATNKCLAKSNKSDARGKATNNKMRWQAAERLLRGLGCVKSRWRVELVENARAPRAAKSPPRRRAA